MKQQLIYFYILILLSKLAAFEVYAALWRPNTATWSNTHQSPPSLGSLSGGAQPDDDRRKKSSSWSKLASKSFSLTGKVIGGTAKQSSKAAYYLLRPKHVELEELFGLWRLDQQVEDLEVSANIELTPQHEVIVRTSNNQVYKSTYHFSGARTWPQSAKVEFVARAFSIDGGEPLRFFYKGYVHRKVADMSVIKLKGKIYRIEATGWRGRQEKYVPVGTFVARRRMKLHDDEDNIYSEYDEEREEEEWHEGEESEEEERSEGVLEDEYDDEYDHEED